MFALSILAYAISVAGAVAAIALVVRAVRGGAAGAGAAGASPAQATGLAATRSSIAWSCVFVLIAVVVAVLGPLGMAEGDPVSHLVLAVVLAGCAASAGRPGVPASAWDALTRRLRRGGHCRAAAADEAADFSADATAPAPARRSGASRHGSRPLLRLVALSLGIAVCTALALELPSNHALWAMEPTSLLLEVALLFALVLLLLGLSRGHGAPAAVFAAVFAGIGLGEHFVGTFKAMPIQPGDLFALGTAATVAGGYQYVLTPYCLYALAACAVGLLLASMARPVLVGVAGKRGAVASSAATGSSVQSAAAARAGNSGKSPVAAQPSASPDDASEAREKAPAALERPLTRRAALGAAAAGAAFLVAQPFINYYDALGIRVGSWYPLRSYYKHGFVPAFISGAQKMVPSKPRGYKRADADALIKRYAAAYARDAKLGRSTDRAAAEAQFKQLKPSVVCIMNESFSDLSIFDKLRCGYQGPVRFLGIDDALLQGVSYMSAYGAGTCNSEFEFLTGHSMAFLGGGVYPYMVYNLAPSENLARQFKGQGYRTVAMHPNHGTNWNRVNVFEDMGFDEFYTIDDVFKGAPELCRKVTDAATYDECLKVLRESDQPVFIHDVTMQNHSGYDTGLIPPDQRVNLVPPGADADHVAWTDEYLALMEESDRAFAAFLDQLRALDKPVVVVMYGDHQPFFSDAYNDAFFPGEGEADHAARIWQTRYVVWANYDVAGSAQASEQRDTSIDNVGALALQAIGAPLSSYQKAHLALMKKMPALSVAVRRDEDGSWHLPDERSASSAAEDDFSRMQYRKLFDHGQSVFATRRQSAANETDPNAAPGADQ